MEEVLEYEGLVYSIISKYSKRYDLDDLYQAGMIGLMDAYRHYNNSFGTKFSSFAYYYIIGEVNKYIRENSGIKVSRELIELKKKIIKTKELMSQKLGREPTNLELSLYLDVSEEDIDNAIIATDSIDSLDNHLDIYNKDNETNADIMDLRAEINNLPEDDKNIILARYYYDLTQSEISNRLGISQVQVSRKEKKILQKLKVNLYS